MACKVACQFMKTPGTNFTDEDLATRMYSAANIYYNTSGTLQTNCIDQSVCGDTGTAGLGDDELGWPWQECSEIIIDMCARGGVNDFFWDECKGNSTALLIDGCISIFSSFKWTPSVWNINAVATLYGLNLNGASNIILTQGHLDPWSSGGYKQGMQDRGIYVMEIPGSAHHLDLRTPNTCDPNTVKNARYQIVQILECWISGCAGAPRLTDLPQIALAADDTKCMDVNQGYPWGQEVSSSTTFSTVVVMLVLLLRNCLF